LNSQPAIRRDDLCTNIEQVFESLFLEIKINTGEKIIFAKIHKSPNGSTKVFFQILEKKFESSFESFF
jgi:hypothetical protein